MEKTRTEQNLPAELWLEIISRLPVKSLLRYRCVSKSWRSLIDDPNFCRSHLNNFKNNKLETHLFGANYIGARGRVCVVYCSETFVSSMVLDPLKSSSGCTKNLLNNYNWNIVCSLDGLVLLRFSSRVMPAGLDGLELILWNPSIRRARVLHSCSPFGESEKYYDLGFGFDPIIGDYKHVRFVKHGESNLRSIELYTVGSGIWRTIQYQDAGGSKWRWKFCDWYRWQCLCCREILYFSPSHIDSGAQELVSFDLSSEMFDSTSLPIDHDGNLIKYGGLMLLDGGCSLGLVHVLGTSGSIWVLESSGADIDSMYWTKRYTFPSRIYPSSPIRYHLYIKKNGEFLVHENKQVTSYDLGTHEEKTLMIDHDLRMVGFKAHAYIEGLLLLHG